MPQPPRTPQPPQGNRRLPPQQARPPQQRPQQRPPQRPAAPAPSVRLAPGPARQGQFVYAGDQTYEQVQHTREEGRWDSIFVPGVKQFRPPPAPTASASFPAPGTTTPTTTGPTRCTCTRMSAPMAAT